MSLVQMNLPSMEYASKATRNEMEKSDRFEINFILKGNKITFTVENKECPDHPVTPHDYIIALYSEIRRMSEVCDMPVHDAIAMAEGMFVNERQAELRLINERPPTDYRH